MISLQINRYLSSTLPEFNKCSRNVVSSPHPKSNLRHIKFHIPNQESPAQKRLRKHIEDTQHWNQEFWSNQNETYIKCKEAFIADKRKELKLTPHDTIGAEELCKFYKKFLDDNRDLHLSYNRHWWRLWHGREASTHFGFQNVSEEEKGRKVYGVFENVAEKYDLMNDAMSLGVHRLWKDYFVHRLSPYPGMRLLDVAGGTGDVGFRVVNYLNALSKRLTHEELPADHLDIVNPLDIDIMKELQSTDDLDTAKFSPDTNRNPAVSDCTEDIAKSVVTICDINKHMLDMGKRKHKEVYGDGRLTHPLVDMQWLVGDAEGLPVADSDYDTYTIAFGIRNCTHINSVLAEAYRVLKPGGRFMCLEFSRLRLPGLADIYELYSFQVIPVLGQVLAGDWRSYQYLVESIRKFPDQEEFQEMIRTAGFAMVTYENLSCGIAAIHSAYKI